MYVRTSSNFSEEGGQLIRSKSTTCHPKFSFENYDYDICLVELEESIQFNDKAQPIKIGEEVPEEGAVGIIAGWGSLWVRFIFLYLFTY